MSNIEKGSAFNVPALCSAALVASEDSVAATKTPWAQSSDSTMSGIVSFRRPPKIIALIGTPSGWSQSGSRPGTCDAGVVKRAFGCDEGTPSAGVHGRRSHEAACSGGGVDSPSHHTPPSGVIATFVKLFWVRGIVR